MAKRTSRDIASELKALGLEGRTLGVHSNLISIGLIEPSPVSPEEEARGLSPIAKTVIDGFVDGVGPQGTFFVPTHSTNFIGNYMPCHRRVDSVKDEAGNVLSSTLADDGYYRRDKSPSLVGALTQAILADPRVIRSAHPSHSIAAIGREAEYLVRGHTPFSQPVGIQNGFSKTVGLDGVIFFVGDTLASNTTFHAYETLLLPALADFFAGTVAVEIDNINRLIPNTWVPNLHRDFYAEKKRRTRAINAMRASGLMREGKLGRGPAFWFEAKAMAKYFAEKVFPSEPDILFCARAEDCVMGWDCGNTIRYMKTLYARKDGSWDAEKVRREYDKTFLEMLKPGVVRV